MSEFKCAVIIPTKNALPIIKTVIDKVLSQKTDWPFEIIVIDSGSKDGTGEYLQSIEQVKVISIDPTQFGHGRTRNQAIAAASSEFVALLTHDAIPADESWLATMVATAESDNKIAGVFGKHLAYENASPFLKRDLDRHFAGFLRHPLVVNRFLDPEKYENDLGWRQFLHFYSDNNSLMRKSVWEKHPYPDVDFAEDQVWAREIVEAGYSKAYAPEAVVYHSHNYGPIEQLRRAYDESKNFKDYFDYNLCLNARDFAKTSLKYMMRCAYETADRQYGKVNIFDKLKYGALNLCRVTGHFLGTNHRKLPQWFAQRLSLDKRIREN